MSGIPTPCRKAGYNAAEQNGSAYQASEREENITFQDLEACARYREEIAAVDESIARLQSEMERVTQAAGLCCGHGQGGQGDRLSAQMARLQELEAERAERVVAMEKHIDWCKACLMALPPQQAAILWLRHGEGLKWEAVARRANYSKHHCYKIYRAARTKMTPNDTCGRAKIVL